VHYLPLRLPGMPRPADLSTPPAPQIGLAEGFPKGESAQAERKDDVEEDQIRAG
jgi:hypothetical protein